MTEPRKIYLQAIDGDDYDATWCSDRINDTDTEYIRADIFTKLQKKYDDSNKKLKALHEAYTVDMSAANEAIAQLHAELARIKPSWDDAPEATE